MNLNKKPRIVFFGTPDIAVWVLEELHAKNIIPDLIVTNPDTPQGRKMLFTPPPVKRWAGERDIEVVQPASLRDEAVHERLLRGDYDLFIVAAYGKMLPKEIVDAPVHKTLNVHPSLLPKFRGASPIRSAILEDERNTGVSIIELDEEMDHGPIIAQAPVVIDEKDWPLRGTVLDEKLARMGGALLAETIPAWIDGTITPKEQNHEEATFCSKITKADGEITLTDDPYKNLLKIRAYDGWPGTFFYTEHHGVRTRVKIIDAELASDGSLHILRVIPEGKKEMDYTDFN
jgi:methionyl-tRNA formyltransferase